VNTATTAGRQRYRVIIFGSKGSRVLLVANGTHFTFPEVEIPALERVAKNLTAAVKRDWGQEIVCLYSPEPGCCTSEPSNVVYMVSAAVNEEVALHGLAWAPVSSLTPRLLACDHDYHVLRTVLKRCRSGLSESGHSPFENLNWFTELVKWIQGVIKPMGLRLTGAFGQVNAAPTFSLIRFETTGIAVWFKAVGPPKTREFQISQQLAKLFPQFVPKILAVRPEWNAWLMWEAEGSHLGESSDLPIWRMVAERLAELQIASIGNTLHLLDLGCHDVRPERLLDKIDPFLETVAQLMEQQEKETPSPLPKKELFELGARLRDSLQRSADCQMPHVLGHIDFNPGNVLAHKDRCVFLDWAEASVGLPFLSIQYLIEHLRRLRPGVKVWELELLSAYAEKWRRYAQPDVIAEHLRAAPLLAAFAYAVAGDAWRQRSPVAKPQTARHLRSLARRMKREADCLRRSLSDRGVSCTS
jgi:hypothetical protein